MNLYEVAAAIAEEEPENHSVLVYGEPKTGKTRFVGTAAEIPEVERIFWFDLERGGATLLNMGLSEAALKKITYFRITDTKQEPFGIETMLKALTAKTPIKICNLHGRVDCPVCTKEKKNFTPFFLPELTHRDLVVIDSGSQLADSAMAASMLGKDTLAKPEWDNYGEQGRWLSDCLSTVQASKYCNFVVITHVLAVEDDEKKDKLVPLMGTKTFSLKCSKYFGTVCYLFKKMAKHQGASGSTFRGDLMTGSRLNISIEKEAVLDMRALLIKGGVLREAGKELAKPPVPVATEQAPPEPTKVEATKQSFAERVAAGKK